MKDDERDDDHRADALPNVEPVFGVAVMAGVRLAREGDPDAVNRVVDDREKDEGPFDRQKERQRMNFVDLFLEDIPPWIREAFMSR